jgi:uncharacterized protein (DUF1778 family)
MLSRPAIDIRGDEEMAEPRPSRAPRSDGPRTTLRVPPALVAIADRMAAELHVSRNDALLRLASHGASLYERERQIVERKEQRWQAVMEAMDARVGDDLGAFTSPEEAYEAVMNARADLLDLPPE